MNPLDYTDKYCVIGAGVSGIAAGKALRQAGVDFDVIERADDVGGNWYYGHPTSSVYRSAHLISSKALTEFPDHPMPRDYPDYPNHEQVHDYLRSYARRFGVYPYIEFNTTVERVERTDSGEWDVTLANGETRRYRGLVIANGHLWDPVCPDFPGEFYGQQIHSHHYKTPDILRDKRVLVVGAGNSGCDIAVEAAQNARATYHSSRRGYYYIPKYVFGRPTDLLNEAQLQMGLPLWLRRWINMMVLRIVVGDQQRYGLRQPDHRLFEAHPIVNQHITYYLGQGDIQPKPNIRALCGDGVAFEDGSVVPVDLIIYATGYKISFPFIDKKHLNYQGDFPSLYMHVFHPEYDNLFVVGLIQPDSGLFWLVDLQARLMARFIQGIELGSYSASRFRNIKATDRPDLGNGIDYLDSTRHWLEIEHHGYRKHVEKLLQIFEGRRV